ncbi:MAG: hypothetical protein V1794_18635 [Candidatus Glassbacteria bacterium]
MLTRFTTLVTLTAALALFTTLGAADTKAGEKKAVEQTVCPVSGKPINKDNYVDHNGKRVYFCCQNCPKKFQQDADAILKKLEAEGIMLASAPMKMQEVCPVSGEKIDKKTFTDYQSQRVYFCCPGCVDKFKSNAAAYIEKMKKEGIELEMVAK